MFDYTKTIFNKTLADLKLFEKIWSIGTLGVYIAYLIYAISTSYGILIANIILLTLSAVYFVFYLAMTIKGSELLRARRKIAKKTYKYSKYIINSATLATALYTIGINPYDVHPFKLLVTVFMALLLVIQLVLEVSVTIVERRFNMFIEAFRADIEFVTNPVNTVKNVFKKITGQEVEPQKERSSDRVYLDNLVNEERNSKSAQKASAKAERNEKISSWLDNHISKFSFMRKGQKAAEETELVPVDIPEYETEIEETEEV